MTIMRSFASCICCSRPFPLRVPLHAFHHELRGELCCFFCLLYRVLGKNEGLLRARLFFICSCLVVSSWFAWGGGKAKELMALCCCFEIQKAATAAAGPAPVMSTFALDSLVLFLRGFLLIYFGSVERR